MPTPVLAPRTTVPAAARAEAERHWRAGVEHSRALRWKEAEKAFARAVRAVAIEPLYWVNLGQARRKLGDLDGAVEAAERALAVDARDPLATQLRLAARMERHRWAEAVEDAEQIARRPDATHQHWLDYGIALDRAGRHREAVSALLQAMTRKLDCFEAYVVMCNAFDRLGLHAEAVECLRTGLALQPGWGQGLGGVVYHSLYACDWSKLEQDLAALHALLREPGPHDFGPFMFLSFGANAATQRRIFADHARRHYGSVVPMPALAPPRTAPGGRLRIGYLSNDFHMHATATLLVQVLERHDRTRVDVRLYSYGIDDGSALRRRIVAAAETFVDVAGQSDREIAQRIRDDGIEILIDLKGYTMHARTSIVAMRPAPIQAAWVGFPGTLAAPFVDYAIVDPVVAPLSMADAYSEKLAYLPDSYQPNDRERAIAQAPGRAACGLPEDAFVFCCFNHTYKIRPEVFEVWCRLLRDVPGSVLWLLESNAQAAGNLRREAAARGIDASRLVFAPLLPTERNLARLTHADLFLDTLPVNAHTTASDSLWTGVPVVTCLGDAFVGRVAASLLHATGLGELVTADLAAYEALARTLATDPVRLGALRARLRETRLEVPLFDSARTARELEALFVRMSERWRAGLAPDHLAPRRTAGIEGERPGADEPRS